MKKFILGLLLCSLMGSLANAQLVLAVDSATTTTTLYSLVNSESHRVINGVNDANIMLKPVAPTSPQVTKTVGNGIQYNTLMQQAYDAESFRTGAEHSTASNANTMMTTSNTRKAELECGWSYSHSSSTPNADPNEYRYTIGNAKGGGTAILGMKINDNSCQAGLGQILGQLKFEVAESGTTGFKGSEIFDGLTLYAEISDSWVSARWDAGNTRWVLTGGYYNVSGNYVGISEYVNGFTALNGKYYYTGEKLQIQNGQVIDMECWAKGDGQIFTDAASGTHEDGFPESYSSSCSGTVNAIAIINSVSNFP